MSILKQEKEVIILCQGGDEEAFETLYKKYYPSAYKQAYRITRNVADAQDAALETMIAVHDNINTLENVEALSSWIHTIVVSKCSRIFRKNSDKIIYGEDALIVADTSREQCSMNETIVHMRFNSDKELMEHFLSMLPKGQEEVMRYYYFHQFNMREIAEKLHISEGTIKSRIHVAKKFLKTQIKRYQREENIILDFKTNTLYAFLGIGYYFFSIRNILSYPATTIGVGSVMAIALIVIVSTSLNKAALLQPNHINHMSNDTSATSQTFHGVDLKAHPVENAKDAYYLLLLWADRESLMQEKTPEEMKLAEELVHQIQMFGSSYYTLLQDSGWLTMFHKYV